MTADPWRWGGPWAGVALVLASAAPAAAQEGGEVPVERYAEPGDGSVNSWLVTGPEGVVLIDAQRALSAGRAVAAAIEATGLPLAGVIITHPHPDHISGLAAVLEAFPGTPVYASAGTIEAIRTDSQGYIAATREQMPEKAPAEQPVPEVVIADDEVLALGGLEFRVDEIGAGEGEGMTMLYLPAGNLLFAGDLVAHEMTGFLLEGRSGAWLDQVASVREAYGDAAPAIYPGHGLAGPFAELLDEEEAKLRDFRGLVRERLDDGALSGAEVEEVAAAWAELYPDHPPVAAVPEMVKENARAVADELALE